MKKKEFSASRGKFVNWFRKIAKQSNRELRSNNMTFLRAYFVPKSVLNALFSILFLLLFLENL